MSDSILSTLLKLFQGAIVKDLESQIRKERLDASLKSHCLLEKELKSLTSEAVVSFFSYSILALQTNPTII